MGTFHANVHVRTDDHEKLAGGLRALPVGACWVFPSANGWATIIEERASTQDEQWIRELAAGMSREAQSASIAFLVHDSDIFCYWLFDRGELLDEFNSCPDYFGDGGDEADHTDVQGRPDVLLRFCRPGTQVHDLERVLQQDQTFAEDQLAGLAELLGIAAERALTDYRDLGDASQLEELGAVFIGDHPPAPGAPSRGPSFLRLAPQDDDDDVGPPQPGAFAGMDISQLLGFKPGAEQPDPLVGDLVQAAADGDLAEIDRLLAAGAALAGRACLTRPPAGLPSAGAKLVGGAALTIPMSPLYAAVAGKQLAAAQRLIEQGADVKENHPLFGSPIHVAATAGAPELLQLLLDSGAGVNEMNAMRQTPLQVLKGLRQMMGQWSNLGSIGAMMPEVLKSQLAPLTQGWDDCARLLTDHGGR